MRRFCAAIATALLLTGCAGLRQAGARDPLAEELLSLNDEELFACGTAAWQAKDYARAAACFATLGDRFPGSPRWPDAMFNAGAAYEAQGAWQLALDRYRAVLPVEVRPDTDLDVVWRAATCLYHLDRYEEAIELLLPVTAEGFRDEDRIHALTYVGVCRVELGQLSEAEADLRRSVALYRRAEARAEERLNDYWAAQAQFFIGEIYRLHFEAVPLDAVHDPEKLGQDLEYKAQLALSAQGHYLRTMRMGNVYWGTAAGQRVGQLYETFYDQMMNAPVPPGLDEHQERLYRGLLRRRVRVLIQKAISVYERTLSNAERLGVRSGFIEKTQQSLDRMKQVLLADAARDEAEGISDEDLERPVERLEAPREAPPKTPTAERAEAPGA